MTTSAATTTTRPSSRSGRRPRLWLLSLIVVGVVATGVHYIANHWPYRYRTVKPLLENVLASQITMDQYHRTYFPNPGFVATGLTLRRNSALDLPPVGSTRSIAVQSSWLDLLFLRNRVRLVEVEGLHVVIPPVGSRANQEDFSSGSSGDFAGPATVVEQLNLHSATLDIMRIDGKRYSFPIRELILRDVSKGHAASYLLDMQNAKPVGHIRATGSFGPLLPKNLGATPVSGDFTFSRANLADIHGISGTLSAAGRFYGVLAAIEADATTDIPNFAVGGGKPTHITTAAHGTINGLNGDIILHTIEAHTEATTVHAEGNIIGSPKVVNLDFAVTNGRAQDLLRPFIHDEVPITGAVWLHSHAYLAPAENDLKFLQRLRMVGTFNIPAERLTNRATEQKLSAFSQRARNFKAGRPGSDSDSAASEDVISSLQGRARIRDGVVSTEEVMFKVPGASARLDGTFNLRNRAVHLQGKLQMQSDISHASTGFKAVLLKPLIPFFTKNNAGAEIPIVITGSPHQYKITQNLLHHK